MVVQGVPDFFDVSPVNPDCLVELLASDVKFFSPIMYVGGELGVDFVRVMRNFALRFVVLLFNVVWFWHSLINYPSARLQQVEQTRPRILVLCKPYIQ